MGELPYFSLDVVNFQDVAGIAGAVLAHYVDTNTEYIFDNFIWGGDTSYSLITIPEAIEALKSHQEFMDKEKDDYIIEGIKVIIETLEALPKLTLINLGGDEKHDHEQAKTILFATSVGGKIIVKK